MRSTPSVSKYLSPFECNYLETEGVARYTIKDKQTNKVIPKTSTTFQRLFGWSHFNKIKIMDEVPDFPNRFSLIPRFINLLNGFYGKEGCSILESFERRAQSFQHLGQAEGVREALGIRVERSVRNSELSTPSDGTIARWGE